MRQPGRWFNGWVESFDSLTFELIEILDAGDKVIGGLRSARNAERRQHAGRRFGHGGVTAWNEGIPRRAELFSSRRQALEAAGLSE